MTIPETDKVTQQVSQAIREIASAYPELKVTADPDGNGGAYVFIQDVALAPIYKQGETWMGFHIVYMYPEADVYPHFVRADLVRKDDAPLGEGTSPSSFQGRPAIQLSRRSNKVNPTTDTALLKLQKVFRWLNNRP